MTDTTATTCYGCGAADAVPDAVYGYWCARCSGQPGVPAVRPTPEKPPPHTYQASVLSREPLVGTSANAFGIIATVRRGLQRAGAAPVELHAVFVSMTSGDYDHLLAVAMANTDPEVL